MPDNMSIVTMVVPNWADGLIAPVTARLSVSLAYARIMLRIYLPNAARLRFDILSMLQCEVSICPVYNQKMHCIYSQQRTVGGVMAVVKELSRWKTSAFVGHMLGTYLWARRGGGGRVVAAGGASCRTQR